MKVNANSYNDFKTIMGEMGVVAVMFYNVDTSTPPVVQQISAIHHEKTIFMCNSPAITETTLLADFPNAVLLDLTISYENIQF